MNTFIITIFIYGILLVGYYFLQKKARPFQTQTIWWKNGLSLFAVNFSITTSLVYSGVIHTEGVSGLWLFWCGYAISGFLPFVFAPLWAKLNFITDNQFLLFRFSGKGAKTLHVFRTVYVGWIIVAFLMSFQLLALLKVITYITGWEREIVLGLISFLLILIALKNKLSVNIKLDFFNIILIIFCFLGILGFFMFLPDNKNPKEYLALTPIFPTNKWNLLVLFLVQTWSVNLFDGSGVEAQRFFATKNKKNVWKVAFLSSSLSLVFSLIVVSINYLGANKLGNPQMIDQEINVLYYLQHGLPDWFLPIVIIAFFAAFITSFEGLLNWGASFLTIDGYKTYINPEVREKKLTRISIFSMLIIVFTSLLITYFNDNLTTLIKVFFSISAGVAPVFVLRWFWMRINAWSQLSAMLSSGVYTYLYQNFVKDTDIEQHILNTTSLIQYSVQLIIITFLTTVTWVCVTFLTKKDDKQTLEDFKNQVFKNYELKNNILKAIVFGCFLILILYSTVKIISNVW